MSMCVNVCGGWDPSPICESYLMKFSKTLSMNDAIEVRYISLKTWSEIAKVYI